ncbi:MAG: heparinase II/III family protein [Hyphomicrobiales bacterium]|nr:heparinase II/III family protein [Hyphomicrobiales bacterium]
MAGSRWRTTATGRARVRTGAGMRAWPARLSAATLRMPGRLIIAPPDPRTHDPTVAEDILAGFFVFAGKVVHAQGRSPFEMTPPSAQWENLLNGFGWLRHLRVAENPLARTNARALISDFLRLRRNNADPAWAPAVTARRLLSWISASPYLLEGADLGFYRRFMRAIGQHARHLLVGIRGGFPVEERFLPAIALCAVSLSSDARPRLMRLAKRALATEIRRCILEDGGHISRSPRAMVDLLLDLLPLRHLFLAKNEDPPELLQSTLARGLPLLRLLRLGDGTLGLFHGMGYMPADALAIVFRYEHVSAEPLLSAPTSGYERLASGTTALLMDVGGPPPFAFSRSAHASALAFEFSDGPWRVVVNCGAPITGTSAAREAARHTAAHSALVVSDTSSCHFETRNARSELGAAIIDRPTPPKVLREEGEAGTRLTAMHHGYARRFGLLHERGLALSPDGRIVHGLDALVDADPKRPAGAVPFALRFHLHPSVRTTIEPVESAVRLDLPSGASWRFEVAGQRPVVEESIFYAAPDGAGRTQQIVIEAQSSVTREIAWRFTRIKEAEGPRPASGAARQGE